MSERQQIKEILRDNVFLQSEDEKCDDWALKAAIECIESLEAELERVRAELDSARAQLLDAAENDRLLKAERDAARRELFRRLKESR